MKKLSLIIIVNLFILANLYAQNGNISKLTIKEIMQGEDFIGHTPSNVNWAEDGKTIYFNWNPDKNHSDSLFKFNLENKKIEKANSENLPSFYGNYNKAKTKKVYEKYGDIFLMNILTDEITQITNTIEGERSPYFLNNELEIAFNKGQNIYVWNSSNGSTKQITNFSSKEEKKDKLNKTEQWLKNDQLALFDVLSERHKIEEEEEVQMDKQKLKFPLEIFTDKKGISNQLVSPTGKFVTYTTIKDQKNKGTIVPHFVTESGYTEDQNTRTKVGDDLNKYELFIYNIDKRIITQIALDTLEGLDYVPSYTKDYPDKEYKNEDRIGYISKPVWNEEGTKAILEIRSNDYKDRWIVLLNPVEATITNLEHQHDEAWIAGPGISGNNIGWMPDNSSVWFQSEKTGYSHLYSLHINSLKTSPLTSGNFEIYNPFISKDKTSWYFTANKNHPGDQQFFKMPINGGILTPLTSKIGKSEVNLSPDEKEMAVLYSFANKPTELFYQKNPVYTKDKIEPTQITYSTTKEFKDYNWRTPEFITFKADDNAEVHARLYEPKTNVKNKAAVIFVHGAGYLQNAHQWWSSYFREYMFHNLLVDNGYTVLDIDYRGSAGYGRDWRTGIYRHMGGKDLSDHVDGAEHLIKNYGIDKEKIGIYGGSYGGFITLMGMFNEPETFKAGAAIRSVGDWAAYNHGYTARILNTPVTDSLAYRRSSPIYFTDGLKGDLLILHGMVDDNVHFQDMVRLSQKLIEQGKTNWEMAIYPVERHGFVEPTSWTDEYKRIFKLFQESLLGRQGEN